MIYRFDHSVLAERYA